MRSSARSSGAAASRIFFSFSSSNKKQKQKRAGVVRCDISPEEKKKKKREEDKDIDRAFAMAVFKRWLSSLGVDLSKTEFVSTRSMGIGGVVLRDAEELDLVFRIPLLVPREGRRMPVAMRWDAFIHSSSSASSSSPLLLGFSAELGEIFVKERLESKLRGVLIEDDDDGDAEEEDASNASSSFPLDSTRTSMLALALMYQDVKARSRRRAIELGIDVEADVFWRNQHPPHWQAYVDLLPTNVDSLLMWSTEELAFLQNSRIGERAKRRKKLVQEEFDVLFSNNNNNNINAGLREEFERLTSAAAAAVTSAEETSPPLPDEKRRQRRRRRLTPFRFETLQEWFEWSYATVLARAFTLPEIEDGALIFCPGLDIFNSARDAAKCEVRLSPHDDISLHATVGGYRAGTQAFHDYADHASGGALLEFGFIYDDDERLNFPLFMDEDEKTPGTRSSTFIYEGATEIDISATAVLRDYLTHPRVLEKCKQLDVLAPSSTSEKPVLRKFLLSNVTKTPWDSSARTKIARPSLECVSKDLLDIVQTIEREVVVANTKTTTASLLLKQIYERELARYSATTIAEDLTTLRKSAREREARGDENESENENRRRRRRRFLVALKLRLSEKILLRACVDDLETTIVETDDDG
jgi:hypothetical protein